MKESRKIRQLQKKREKRNHSKWVWDAQRRLDKLLVIAEQGGRG